MALINDHALLRSQITTALTDFDILYSDPWATQHESPFTVLAPLHAIGEDVKQQLLMVCDQVTRILTTTFIHCAQPHCLLSEASISTLEQWHTDCLHLQRYWKEQWLRQCFTSIMDVYSAALLTLPLMQTKPAGIVERARSIVRETCILVAFWQAFLAEDELVRYSEAMQRLSALLQCPDDEVDHGWQSMHILNLTDTQHQHLRALRVKLGSHSKKK